MFSNKSPAVRESFSLLACLALSSALWSQVSTSQISGLVQDPAGSGVPRATVTLTNTGTGQARSVFTDASGEYSIANLPPGSYQLKVAGEGFSSFVQSGIVLEVDVNPRINVALQVGAIQTEVTVKANAGMVETSSAGVGQVIDENRMVDLPLNGRQVSQFITLAGAAVSTFNGANADTRHYPSDSSFSVAGGSRTATNFLLDGGSNNDIDNSYGLPMPFPDAVQEFKVETNALPANYGNHSGGAVNVITKSGTNEIHGDAFEFIRNYLFNARNFFAASRDSLKRNQFGGTLGGPVLRNKLFFFAAYQGTIVRSDPPTSVSYVPTAAVLAGDFTQILSPACNAGKTTTLKAPFAGNRIDPSLFNPVALKVIALMPLASNSCGKIQYGIPAPNAEQQGMGRVDWQRTSSDAIFGRWFVANYAAPSYYTNNLLTTAATGQAGQVQSIIAGDTRVLNPATVNSFRAAFTRSMMVRTNAPGTPTMTDLGSNVTSMVSNYTGQVSASGYFSLGGIGGYFVNNTLNLSEGVNMTRGSHQILAGFNWIHTQLNGLGPFQMNPRFTFNGSITGNALADFMVGSPATVLQGNGQVAYDRLNSPSLYVQDNWRVGRTLTVNAGLRWDPFLPQHHKQDMVSIFEPDAFYQGIHSKVYPNAPAGMFFHGDAGFPGDSDTFQRLADFSPRVGVVFDPRGQGAEVVRAGYGIFYDSPWTWMMSGFPQNSPWGESITLNAPSGGLSNPWLGYPGGNPFPTPTPPPSNFVFPTGGSYVSMPLHVRSTYVQQWNIALEKQIGKNLHLSATYMGNKTTHLWLAREIDPAVYIPGNCAAGQYGLTAAGACSTLANVNQRRVFYLANPAQGQLLGSVSMLDDGGNANYNGLLLAAERRLSGHFTALVNYTQSHCLDQGDQSNGGGIGNQYQNPNNRAAEYGNCATDRRQIFNTSLVARIPSFGEPFVRRIVSNWEAAGIFTASSGAPLNVTVGSDNALAGEGAVLDRPNLVGNPNVSNPTILQWFNTTAFAKAAPGSYGNLGRNTIVGPGSWDLDMSLSRAFSVSERRQLVFRAEAFNLMNHTRLGNPATAMNSNVFGQITTALDPRIMQGAVKFIF